MAVARFLLAAGLWLAGSRSKVMGVPKTLPCATASDSLAMKAARSGGQLHEMSTPPAPSQLPRCRALALTPRSTPKEGTRSGLMAAPAAGRAAAGGGLGLAPGAWLFGWPLRLAGRPRPPGVPAPAPAPGVPATAPDVPAAAPAAGGAAGGAALTSADAARRTTAQRSCIVGGLACVGRKEVGGRGSVPADVGPSASCKEKEQVLPAYKREEKGRE